MEKEQLLQELSLKINAGEISRDELLQRFHIEAPRAQAGATEASTDIAKHFSVTKMLYVLGAAIVVIGIIIFVSQIWDDIGSAGRILVTLGLGFLITAIGSYLSTSKPEESLGTVFHFIGGMLIPGGAIVALSELHVDFITTWPYTGVFGCIFLFYMLLSFYHKRPILTFFAIANGTAFIYLLVQAMLQGSLFMHGDLYAYLTMVIGVSYLLLSESFKNTWNEKLIGVLCFFGSAGFLGAAFSQVFDSVPWQMVYFLLVIGGLYLAVYMKNKSILVVSTLFLVAHISYITSEYFANSIGWPISLVILGFIFIGLGYASITINKKYIA